ncbi:hypothetical protein [Sharpea azabuensis]|uniref:hypothetical protein n=1 Tax=Sharpea azabuensis TaxID=322505 RepID=UPI0013DA9992|nr:hypothetical protein [Sharpea azabuensis]
MKYNMSIKHLFRMFGLGVLSIAIAGCGTAGSKTKSAKAVQSTQLADIEKTSLKTYGADEKTKDGMRVKNSDGTYTYGVANVNTTKLRKDEEVSVGYDNELKIYERISGLNEDKLHNNVIFQKTENNDLVGIDLNVKIDDNTLAEYKKAGVLPANATKKTAKKMVKKEIAYIKKTLERDISSDDLDLSDKLTKVSYEYEKRGYYMDLSDKEKTPDGTMPKYWYYINNAVETYMIDLGNDNFSAGINFNIGSPEWNAGNKGIQIIGQRYGFDSLCKDDKYDSDISKTKGLINILLNKVHNYSNKDWYKTVMQYYDKNNKGNSFELDDELSKLD